MPPTRTARAVKPATDALTATIAAVEANPRAVKGANNPPTTEEMLKARHAAIWTRLTAWLEKTKKTKIPKNEADCAVLDALYLEGRDIRNDAEAIRVKEKEIPAKLVKEIDETFNTGVRDVIGSETGKPGKANAMKQAAADFRLAATREAQRKADEQAAAARAAEQEAIDKAKASEEKGAPRVADAHMAGAEAIGQTAGRLEAFASAPVAEASRSVVNGVRSSVDAVHVCIGVDRDKLAWGKIAVFLKSDILVDAVNRYLKQSGEKALDGATIVEQAKGRVGR